MNCEEVRSRLAEGDELVAHAPEIQAHLDACPNCQALVRRLAEVDEALDGLPGIEPPPETVKRAVAAVREEIRRPRQRDWRPVYAIAATATVGVLVLVIAVPMFTVYGENAPPGVARFASQAKVQDRYTELATLEEGKKSGGRSGLDTNAEHGRWQLEVRTIDSVDSGKEQTGKDWKVNPFCPTCPPPASASRTAMPSAGEDIPAGTEASEYYQRVEGLEQKVKELNERGLRTKSRLTLLPDTEIADGKDLDVDGEARDDDGRPDHGWWAEGHRGPVAGLPASDEKDDKDKGLRLDRSEVQRSLSTPNKVATDARIVPHMKNGKPDGFKIYSIREGSVYDQAGLKNGDVVRKINGKPVDSPDKALEVYENLRTTNRVEIDVERKGRGEKVVIRVDDRGGEDATAGDAMARVTAGPVAVPEPPPIAEPTTTDHAKGKPAKSGQHGQLEVSVGPVGAKVFIDGQEVAGGQRVDLKPGVYRVQLQRQGYATQEQTVEVPSGKLVMLKPPPVKPTEPVPDDSSLATSTFEEDEEEEDRRKSEETKSERERRVRSRDELKRGNRGKGDEGALAYLDTDEGDFDDILDEAPSRPPKKKAERGHKKRAAVDPDFGEDDDFEPTPKRRPKKAEPLPPPPKATPKGKPLPDTLDKSTVLAVIKRGLPKIKKCAQEQGSRDRSRVVKKIILGFTIERNGQVTDVSVGPEKVKGSYLEACVKRAVKKWRYPKFFGESIKIKLPLPVAVRFSPTLPEDEPEDDEEPEQDLEALKFIPADGYFANTYLPGDPTVAWLRRSLEQRLFFGEQPLTLERAALPYAQPFDAPESDGMSVFLGADRAAIEGPTRLTLQVGLKGSLRHARRRAPLNTALVIDLRTLPSEGGRRILWSLADALAADLSAGDRFTLLVAGVAEPLQVEASRFGAASVRRALARAFETREAGVDADNLGQTLSAAFDAVSGAASDDSPLGASLVLLASASPHAGVTPAIESLAHARAVEGTTLTTIGAGASADAHGLARLALAGQGRRRLVAEINRTRGVLEEELAASGRVVARAVRLRIRLAQGVKLVSVLGSHPLTQERVVRVKAAELAIDRKVSTTLGIAADRGEDESGIQIVIPAYYAGDDHVILLDVVADGPGPLADVRVRYKDLVNLRNNAARASLALPAGERPAGPLALNVQKNLLAYRIAASLNEASARIAAGDPVAAAATLARAAARLARFQARLFESTEDPELARDRAMLAEYAWVLAHPEAVQADPVVRTHLVRSLSLAGRVKLPSGDRS